MIKLPHYAIFLFFLTISLNVYLMTSNIALSNDRDSPVKSINQMISLWVESPSFLDDVYTFNTDAIDEGVNRILKFYQNDIDRDICISVYVKSFSDKTNESEAWSSCSPGNSMSKMTSKNKEIKTNEFIISIGNDNLGTITYFMASSNTTIYRNIIIFILLAISYSVLLFICLRARSKNKVIIEKDQNQEKTTNITNIMNRNKRSFAIHKDVVYISYNHPYCHVFYRNGQQASLRCSLTELEKSFPTIDLVRVNRSISINEVLLMEQDIIKTNLTNNSISIRIKNTKIDLIIGNSYKKYFLIKVKGEGQ